MHANILNDVSEIQRKAQKVHEGLLEFISGSSASESLSSVRRSWLKPFRLLNFVWVNEASSSYQSR
jgi:hypothetical protein